MHKRRYADVSFGQIHYRTAGPAEKTDAPALLLLHQSPRSSAEYGDLIEELASDYLVFAPDTPGNGLSDPLPLEVPGIADYADAVIEFLDAIGLDTVLVYGFHTGASIAACTAARYPERIRFAVANGVAIMRGPERADFVEHYSPPLELKADGSHLTWLWERFQKQSKFFPWYKTGEEHRIDVPPYTPEKCQGMVEDFLLAGNNYIGPYNAAFTFDPVADNLLPANNLLIMSVLTDPLCKYLDLLPEGQAVFRGKDQPACFKKALQELAGHS